MFTLPEPRLWGGPPIAKNRAAKKRAVKNDRAEDRRSFNTGSFNTGGFNTGPENHRKQSMGWVAGLRRSCFGLVAAALGFAGPAWATDPTSFTVSYNGTDYQLELCVAHILDLEAIIIAEEREPWYWYTGVANEIGPLIVEEVGHVSEQVMLVYEVPDYGEYKYYVFSDSQTPTSGYLGATSLELNNTGVPKVLLEGSCPVTPLSVPPNDTIEPSQEQVSYAVDETIHPITFTHNGEDIDLDWSVSPSLPEGLSLDPDTGTISGTTYSPTAMEEFTVTATETGGDFEASAVVEIEIERAETTLLLSADKYLVASGQDVVLTATLSSSRATGEVSFIWGETILGTKTIVDGSVTLTHQFDLPDGQYSQQTISASYDGDQNYLGSGVTPIDQAITVDDKQPEIKLTSDAYKVHSGPFTVYVQFSEGVEDFSIEDVAVSNGQASDLSGSGAQYQFTVTPQGDGLVEVSITNDGVSDSVGNSGAAVLAVEVEVDETAPVLTLSGPEDVVVDTFEVVLSLSEPAIVSPAFDFLTVNTTTDILAADCNDDNTVCSFEFEPIELGKMIEISVPEMMFADEAGNISGASNTLSIMAGSPASEFEEVRDEVEEIVRVVAAQQLRAQMGRSQSVVDDAARIFKAGEASTASQSGYKTTRFDVDGQAGLNPEGFATKGTFFGQKANWAGDLRRFVTGSFDIQADDRGIQSATIASTFGLEKRMSDTLVLGGFVEANLSKTSIETSLEGRHNAQGASLGAYAITTLGDAVYLDGYLTFAAQQNDLGLENEVLELTSDYVTRSALIGARLSGVMAMDGFEIWPELSVSHGKTWIGDLDFTGAAYGLVDDQLVLGAGEVAITRLKIAPRFVFLADPRFEEVQLEFAPALSCERIEAAESRQDCGGGAELALTSQSADGATNIAARISYDRLGTTETTGLSLELVRRF